MSALTVATWNVNSIKARLEHLQKWLKETSPDVVLLQETKTEDDNFPRLELESLGWNLAIRGQKSYNGVAILSRPAIVSIRTTLDGDGGEARYIEATLENGVIVASAYAPMGQSVDSDRFPFKLAFLDALVERAKKLLYRDAPFVIGGDYNVAPDEADVFDVREMTDQVLFHPEERKRWRRLINLGLTDAFRALNPDLGLFSWWDYRAGAWSRDRGLRIDHLALSPALADRIAAAGIDKTPRGWEKPSDHTPVWCRINLPVQQSAYVD